MASTGAVTSNNPDETRQPKMLAPTQIESHVSRLTAVSEGLRKYEDDDGRAAECVRILSVAIKTLESEPFPTNAAKEPFVEEVEEEEETIEQVQERERAPGGAASANPSEDVAQNSEDRIPFEESSSEDTPGVVVEQDDSSITKQESPVDPPDPSEQASNENDADPQPSAEQRPTTGFGSERGIV